MPPRPSRSDVSSPILPRLIVCPNRPIPHIPACRFDKATDLEVTLQKLAASGAADALILGGNDQYEREKEDDVPFPTAGNLLATGALKRAKFKTVVLAGHPEGHPGLGKDAASTAKVLAEKVEAALRAGHAVAVATQFCFNAQRLVAWLDCTRRQLNTLVARVAATWSADVAPPVMQIQYFIGLPGPTKRKKLQRIAKICEVPSLFLGSAFDLLDLNGDGNISDKELLAAAAVLGASPVQLRKLFQKYSGKDQLLQRSEFAAMVAALARDNSCEGKDSDVGTGEKSSLALGAAHSVSGPSVFVTTSPTPIKTQTVQKPQTTATSATDNGIVRPKEIVLALAAYCAQAAVAPGEVRLHWFPFGGSVKDPFGGVLKTAEVIHELCDGTWPTAICI